MMKMKILKTIQAENLVSMRVLNILNSLYRREEEWKFRFPATTDTNLSGCFGQFRCHLCSLSVKQFAACSTVNILEETSTEY